jgi:hypothetical protein
VPQYLVALPYIAIGGPWTTTLLLRNESGASADAFSGCGFANPSSMLVTIVLRAYDDGTLAALSTHSS